MIDHGLLLHVDLVTHHCLFVLLTRREVTTVKFEWLVLIEDLGDGFVDGGNVAFSIVSLAFHQLNLPLEHILINLHRVDPEGQFTNDLLLERNDGALLLDHLLEVLNEV